jgi:hypothetical protein
MNKDFYLGDSFAVTKRVKEELWKVELVRLTRSSMLVFHVYWISKRRKLCGSINFNCTKWRVMIFRVRHRRKVSYLVSHWIEASCFRDNMPGIVGARWLTLTVNGKEERLSVLYMKLYTYKSQYNIIFQVRPCVKYLQTEYQFESEDARCCNCDGNHVPEKEVKVVRIKAVE